MRNFISKNLFISSLAVLFLFSAVVVFSEIKGGSSDLEDSFTSFPADADIYSCSVDADCVLVKSTCGCSCSGCGPDFDTSINVKYLSAWKAKLNCDYNNMMCPMVCCNPAEPTCVEGKCSFSLGEIE